MLGLAGKSLAVRDVIPGTAKNLGEILRCDQDDTGRFRQSE